MKRLRKKSLNFVKKQFRSEATNAQTTFDILFGIVLPSLCFVFDPIVFKLEFYGLGKPYLADYKPFAYLFSFSSIILLSLWLYFQTRMKWLNAILSGVFFVGATFCLVIGLLLMPLSLIGLIFVVGVLGFTPFFTGFVYLRNGVRAMKLAKEILNFKFLINTVVLSAILSFVFPAIFNLKVKQAVREMANGDVQTIEASAKRLRYFGFLVNLDEAVLAYGQTEDGEKQKALEKAYKDIIGEENISQRYNRITD